MRRGFFLLVVIALIAGVWLSWDSLPEELGEQPLRSHGSVALEASRYSGSSAGAVVGVDELQSARQLVGDALRDDEVPVGVVGVVGRVVDAGGEGLAGARVELWLYADFSVSPSEAEISDLVAHEIISSGTDGVFEAQGLVGFGGFLHLAASQPGLATTERFGCRVRPGRQLDVGEIELVPPGSLAGSVTAAAEPLAGARLWLSKLSQPKSGLSSRALPAGKTDANGRFVMKGLGPGAYSIGAVAPGWALSFSDFTTIGGGVEVELKLEPGEAVPLVLLDASSGLPLAGAIVEGHDPARIWAAFIRQESDAKGRVIFPGLTATSKLELWCKAEGYVRRHLTLDAPSRESPTVIELTPSPTLRIHVSDDGTGAPIAGAVVQPRDSDPGGLHLAESLSRSRSPREKATDAAGLVQFELGARFRRFLVLKPGFAPASIGPLEDSLTSGEDLELEVRLQPGAMIELGVLDHGRPVDGARVELVLAREDPGPDPNLGAAPTPRTAFFRELSVERLQVLIGERSVVLARRDSGPDGLVSFGALAPGRYAVHVHGPSGSGDRTVEPLLVFPSSTKLRREVELSETASVSGVVLGGPKLAGGQLVSLWKRPEEGWPKSPMTLPRESSIRQVLADSDGRFSFANLEPGGWRAVALVSRGAPEWDPEWIARPVVFDQVDRNMLELELAPGSHREIDLMPQEHGRSLSGRVMVQGEPLGRARVAVVLIENPNRRIHLSGWTDERGDFVLGPVHAGTWEFRTFVPLEVDGKTRWSDPRVSLTQRISVGPSTDELRMDFDISLGQLEVEVAWQGLSEHEDEPWLELEFEPSVHALGPFELQPGAFSLEARNRSFVIRGIPVGDYTVKVGGTAAPSDVRSVSVHTGFPARLDLSPEWSEPKPLDIEPGLMGPGDF